MAYGVRVGIRVNNAAVLEELDRRFPPGWKPAASPVVERLYSFVSGGIGERSGLRSFNILYADALRVARTMDREEALATLESQIQLYVAEHAQRRVFVHAGVVGWKGQAIVIPGRSFSGKSTLVASLLDAGATYYSDEYAVLDERGWVHPYPKPLALRTEAGEDLVKPSVEPPRGPSAKPLPVGMVVSTSYRRGGRWRPQQMSPGRGVLALLANTVPARRRPAASLRTLQQAVSHALVLQGARGEAEEAAASLLRQAA